jgi:hypothetical protein
MSVGSTALSAVAIGLFMSASPGLCLAQTGKGSDSLAGAWEGKVQFKTGA